jgi:integrase
MGRITDRQLSGLKSGVWLSESLGKGHGTFLARRTGDGVQFYFRYTLPDGKRDTLKIAAYGQVTLKAARDEGMRLSGLLRQHPTLRDWLDEQKHVEGEALRQDRHDRVNATFKGLLEAYAGWLEQQGKPSAKQVRGAIQRHVLETWPELAGAKANSLSKRDLTKIVSRVVEAGKGREAAKLRAYIRAAYAAALRADSDPAIPPALHGFNLSVNPASELASLSQYNQPRDVILTLPELRAFWVRILKQQGTTASAIRLCVLLGGQRPTQLVRIKSTDVDLDAGTVTMYDPKGRRAQARRHVLPLTELAQQEIEPYLVLNAGGYLLSSRHGKLPLRQETLSNAFHDIAKVMRSNGEITKDIRLCDLRGTIETLLAANGISMDVRAQLQSHGLGGIQNRHYDRHSYMEEKRNALSVLEELLIR